MSKVDPTTLIGRTWGSLSAEERASLPVGTTLRLLTVDGRKRRGSQTIRLRVSGLWSAGSTCGASTRTPDGAWKVASVPA